MGFNVISEHLSGGTLDKTYVTAPKGVGAASPGAAMPGILVTQGPVGMILAEITGSNPAAGSGRYYAQDNIQSTRGVFDDNAVSLGKFEYTPFGTGFASGGPADLTHRFTGLDLDPLTGQYYAPYRYYDPTTARWLTRDPLGMVDGPNVYGYAGNPTRWRDPLGLEIDTSDGVDDFVELIFYYLESFLEYIERERRLWECVNECIKKYADKYEEKIESMVPAAILLIVDMVALKRQLAKVAALAIGPKCGLECRFKLIEEDPAFINHFCAR